MQRAFLQPVYSTPAPGSTNAPTVIGYAPKDGAVRTFEAIGSIAPILPPPANGIVGGLLVLGMAAVGAFAKMKTNKVNTLDKVLTAVVAGVEAAGDATTKKQISSAAIAGGVSAELEKKVNP